MATEPTELDARRAEYARQIIAHCNDVENRSEDVQFYVDNLLMEWGAEAYKQGWQHAIARIIGYAKNL